MTYSGSTNHPHGVAFPDIAARGISVTIDGTAIVSGANVLAPPGKITSIIGPNGSGKSTLLRAIYRAVRPSAGAVHIGGRDIATLGAKENARARAVVTQHQSEAADFTVREIVDMGRSPHKRAFAGQSSADRQIVDDALTRVGMHTFADRFFADLSGGERQRVLLARALAQQAPAILLDEPTNHLDVQAQLALLDLLGGLGATIVVALHDLNQALSYSDHVIVMSAGSVVAAGGPGQVITPPMLANVFGVKAELVTNPFTGAGHLVFAPSATFSGN